MFELPLSGDDSNELNGSKVPVADVGSIHCLAAYYAIIEQTTARTIMSRYLFVGANPNDIPVKR